MPIADLPLDPNALRDARTPLSTATQRATGIRVVDTYRQPVRDDSGRFVAFRWFA